MYIPSTQEDKLLSKHISKSICGKDICFVDEKNDNNLIQSVTMIYVSDVVYAVHEISHWIACDPVCRSLDNLGFVNDDIYNRIKYGKLYYRMTYEECLACILTKLIFNKYFRRVLIDEDDRIRQENVRIEHIGSVSSSICCKRINWDMCDMEKRALELFNQYVNNI